MKTKYLITKTDGTPVDPNARYFVLRLDDPTKPDNKAARKALVTYVREAAVADPAAAMAAMDLMTETNPALRELMRSSPGAPLTDRYPCLG